MTILLERQPLRIRKIGIDHEERIKLFSLVVRKRSQIDPGLFQGLQTSIVVVVVKGGKNGVA
jgi:hypothetical protein